MKNRPPPQPRSTGRYACGTETHARIIDAAIGLFGERGFEAASTREIARRAGILAPLLNYHFENKEGLYRACAAAINARAHQFFGANIANIQQVLQAQAPSETLMAQLEALMLRSLEFLLTDEKALQRRLFITQDLAGNGPGGMPDETHMQHRNALMRLYNQLVAALCNRNEDDPEVRIRTLTLQGQVAIFYTFRLPALNMLEWEQIDAARLQQIGDTVISNTRILIKAWRGDSFPSALTLFAPALRSLSN